MSIATLINSFLILIGACIMLISIIRLKDPIGALQFVTVSQRKQISISLSLHRTLMIFFLCGYLIVLTAFILDYPIVSGSFVSVIFLTGAVFVYIGIVVQSRLLSEMQSTLQGIIPICCKCKKIRFIDADPHDPRTWKGIEQYISEKTHVGFSHGYCPECLAEEMKTFAE